MRNSLQKFTQTTGLDDEQELFQYVLYDTEKPKGPRRINLDDPSPSSLKTYAPPTSLKVHLSKIDMPELKPRPDISLSKSRSPSGSHIPPIPPRPELRVSSEEPELSEKARLKLRDQKLAEREARKSVGKSGYYSIVAQPFWY